MVTGIAAAALALPSISCDLQRAARDMGEEMVRDTHVRVNGPVIVASVAGSSAPAGGPAVLNLLVADAGWRMVADRASPGLSHVPSPFDVPDPNRPARISRPAE